MARRQTAKKRAAPTNPKSKSDIILALLRRKTGASTDEMATATGWQAHSVRGFMSGTVKKKLALKLEAEKPDGGARRYFVRAS